MEVIVSCMIFFLGAILHRPALLFPERSEMFTFFLHLQEQKMQPNRKTDVLTFVLKLNEYYAPVLELS